MRRLTVLVPAFFLLCLLILLEVLRSALPSFAVVFIGFAICSIAILVFSRAVFGVVGRLQGRLYRQNAELRALYKAGLMVTTNLGLRAVLQTVADSSRELANARYAVIFVGQRDEVEEVVTAGYTPEQRQLIRELPMNGLTGHILRAGRPYRTSEVVANPHYFGVPEGLPTPSTLMTAPLFSGGMVIGHIFTVDKNGGEFTDEDHEMLETLAVQASIAIRNANLFEEAEEAAALRERERIAMTLHDGVIQQLYGVGLRLDSSLETLESRPELVREDIDGAIESLNRVIREVRSHIFDLRPNELADRSLKAGLAELLMDLEVNSLIDTDFVVDSGPDPTGVLSEEQRVRLLEIAREALENVRKHSQARRVRAEVSREPDLFILRIVDDGVGIAQDRPAGTGRGLDDIRQHVSILGGELTVGWTTENGGTSVSVTIPLN
ncbi:MAG TPA: GAF domain-containing protein [Dehalococcoidia bacterium]|nr:GAF domain-containing protein [Dehalococcoidia bacterium]